jgi:hypothetical protein
MYLHSRPLTLLEVKIAKYSVMLSISSLRIKELSCEIYKITQYNNPSITIPCKKGLLFILLHT